jgi:hypothetical protein
MADDLATLRHRLKAAGYSPIPCEGKRPPMKGWDEKINANDDEIQLWSRLYPLATNTGVFTRLVPTIDVDILAPEAAKAVEMLVRERHEEHGNILVRFGLSPKRAIPFRTDEPFAKITRNVIAPNGSAEKLELLGDGQQFIVAGIHPHSRQPYTWFGGTLTETKREMLPYVREGDARDLVDLAVGILVNDFGYTLPPERPKDRANGDPGGTADWGHYLDAIHVGRDLHESTLVLSAKLIASGMGEAAAVNLIRSELERSEVLRDQRWQDRYDDIPRLVAGMAGKPKRGGQEQPQGPLIKTSADFIAGFVPPDYILDGILQQGFLYSLTGATGAGKTSITLRLAASTALEKTFANRETRKGRVLYLAAENPDDARMRWIALGQHMGFDPNRIDVFFSDRKFTISKMMPTLRGELERHGGEFGLVIIDTGPAFFEGDDENSRAQMGSHAKMFRDLIDVVPGRPCVIVNVHPVKNAAPDNLQPAGGGSFLNEVDGNLTASKTESAVDLHWQGKFRGPEFAPMHFLIRTVTHQDLKDKKGRLIPTCLAEWISEAASEEIAKAKVDDENRVLELISRDPKITWEKIAIAMGWKLHNGDPNRTRAGRCIAALVKDKLVKKTRSRTQVTAEGKKALNGGEEEDGERS